MENHLPADTIEIRPATEADVPLLLALIKDLAAYERLSDEVVATEAVLRDSLFGERPYAEVLLGYCNGSAVGYALFFFNFSTFLGRPGIFLEDIYVQTAFQGKGIGKSLFLQVARVAAEKGCGRLEFAVLDWNRPAIDFYRGLGAEPQEAWTIFRITRDRLGGLAAAGSGRPFRHRLR